MDTEQGFTRQLGGTTELLKDLSIKKGTNQESVIGHHDEDKRKAKFNKCIERAKELGRQGQIEEALRLFEKAYDIHQSEKLYKKIQKLKEAIELYKEEEQQEEEEEDNGMREVGEGFYLPTEIHQALYPYQLEGVLWFWRLYKQGKGGILGDDMGLGKTIQVISFLAGMFDAELIKTVLIVMPVSLMTNWEKEFNTWAPGIRVKAFHGSNKKERMRNLEKVQRKTGVCLTTYGLIVSSHEALGSTPSGNTFTWDYIILDEGHKIKNTTKTSKNIREIPATNHFILTGTPVQNNLREMWALFDFACEGKLLGTSRTFKQEYEGPIVRARERDASAYEKRIGMEMSESLRKLIEPHFLRRTKAMVLEKKKQKTDSTDGAGEDKENKRENSVKMPGKLTRKNDFIVWLFMSDTQLKIYSDFLGLERVKEMLMSTRSPLAELNVLKKICDHPRLLSTLACEQLGLDEEDRNVDLDSSEVLQGSSFATQPKGSGPSDRVLVQESGKMVFLIALMENLKDEGHRCLIFSQSRKMLDIIQRVITHMGHKILRIDGTITSTAERQLLINTFQTDSSYSCFLLTTQVGGVGITLTAADRVVIFDPSWNPATDAQAVDRVYRIGQKKTVVIYRLITCGTLEEKIYRKQIFKDALMKQTTGVSKNPFRYFTRQELRDLFTLDDPYTSKTQLQLDSMHSQHRKTDEILDKHIKFLQTLNIFGITDHDLMYSQEDVETPDEMNGFSDNEAIQARVLRAQNLMAAEAGRNSTGGGTYLARPVPASCPRPTGSTPAHPEIIALPQGLRQSLPLREEALTAKQKVQARIDGEWFTVPKREDTTRFQPRQLIQHVSSVLPPPSPVVVDLTSPVQPPSSPTPGEKHSDSLLDLAELDKLVNGEGLEKEFASLNIGSSHRREEAAALPASSTFTSEQEESCIEEAPKDWPPKDEFSDTAAKKKESRRRKSMSQRIELPEIDDSDGEQFDDEISKEGEEGSDLIVIPHSRDNSIVQQNESTKERNRRRSSHEPAVERDFNEEYLINEFVSTKFEASEGSIPIPSPEPVIDQPSEIIDSEVPENRSSLCETTDDDDETKDLSERSRVNKNSESESDVIKSDFSGSMEEPGDERVVDRSLQSAEREFANAVSLSQDSYEEAETSDNEIVDGTDSAVCVMPLIDFSSEGIGIEVPPSPTADNNNDEERPDFSASVRTNESPVDESCEIQDDKSRSEDHMKSQEITEAKHRVGMRQIMSDDEDDSRRTERGEPNDLPFKDEVPTRQKRIGRTDSVGSESDNAEDVKKSTPESLSPRAEKAEDLDDEQIHQVQGNDVSEKDEDSGNISDVETHDATGSSITNGSRSLSVESCESQSPSSSSSRGEYDEPSPKSSHGTRPRVRHLVSSGDESDEGGDGEYAIPSTEGCDKDQILEVEYSCKKNAIAESICQESNGSWSLLVSDKNSSSMDECHSAAEKMRCCPIGLHTSDVIEMHKCACVVSEEDLRKYHECLDIARQLELAGRTKEAFSQYLTALDFMDSELELHKKVLGLAKTANLH